MSEKSIKLFSKRKNRNRYSLKRKSNLNHRLSVFRSNANIYVQLIDDVSGSTIVAASSLDKDLKTKINNNGGNIKAAETVGLAIAKKAMEKGIKEVSFDRGGYIYHGRVKALAEAARKEGLKL